MLVPPDWARDLLKKRGLHEAGVHFVVVPTSKNTPLQDPLQGNVVPPLAFFTGHGTVRQGVLAAIVLGDPHMHASPHVSWHFGDPHVHVQVDPHVHACPHVSWCLGDPLVHVQVDPHVHARPHVSWCLGDPHVHVLVYPYVHACAQAFSPPLKLSSAGQHAYPRGG